MLVKMELKTLKEEDQPACVIILGIITKELEMREGRLILSVANVETRDLVDIVKMKLKTLKEESQPCLCQCFI